MLVDAERAGGVVALLSDDDDVAMAAITLAELRLGALLGTGRRGASRRSFVDAVAATVPIVDYGAAAAEAHARLLVEVRRQGRPRGAHDLVIAATALATERIVVTGDLPGFQDLPGVAVRPA